jgi:3-hydroxybutyrate dehydrogenase
MTETTKTSSSVNERTHPLKGRVAIVTGASRGLGKAIALELARQGAILGVCARSAEKLSLTQAEIKQAGSPCLAATCDVRNESDITAFVNYIKSHFGGVDILVNNAGVYKTEPVATHSLSAWQEVLNINLTGAMLFCRSVLPIMQNKQWGRIINISSVSGRTGEIWGSAYSASKFGMIGLTQSLALEVAQKGITVNAVCPGWVFTDMTREQLNDPEWNKRNATDPKEALSNACFAVPQNRFIEPDEVAGLVAYLAGDAARGITGQAINICGGLSLQ